MSLIPFETNSSICVAGGTSSGKTFWVHKFLLHLEEMYKSNPPVQVMYCYGVHQPLFDQMEKEMSYIEFHPGIPTQTEIEQFTSDGRHRLICLDDLMSEVTSSKTMQDLFCQYCHHRNLSVIFITQNIFQQGKFARTIALNTHYLVLLRNMRNASQVNALGRQLYPGNAGMLEEIYKDATSEAYGYLVIDTSPHSDDRHRLRTKIFPGETPIIYVPKTQA